MRILIVAPYCSIPGESNFNRFFYLGKLLSKSHEVILVTSTFNHFVKRHREVVSDNQVNQFYCIKFVQEPGYKSNASLERVWSHKIFIENFKDLIGCGLLDDVDLVYSAYPMIETNIILGKYKKNYKYKLVVDVQDVWPEAFSAVVPLINFIPRCILPFTSKANTAYRYADALIAVSDTYLRRALEANPDAASCVTYIGADQNLIQSISASSDIDRSCVNFVYIGTLSYSYDVETIIKYFSSGAADKNFRFHIVGDGPHRNKLESIANENCIFHGVKSYIEMIAILKSCDYAFNPIKSTARQSITNKLSDYISVGLPIINSQECSEVSAILKNYSSLNYKSGSIRSLANAMSFVSKAGLQSGSNNDIASKFDRSKTYDELIDFLTRL